MKRSHQKLMITFITGFENWCYIRGEIMMFCAPNVTSLQTHRKYIKQQKQTKSKVHCNGKSEWKGREPFNRG